MEKNLKDLIKQGEGATLEFKRSISSLEKIAKTMSAFANSKGGTILIGVADNGEVKGINLEEELFMIQQAASFYCQPAIDLEWQDLEVDDLQLLLVTVPESAHKPHMCVDTTGNWRCYVRTGDQCLLAADTVVRALKLQQASHDAAAPPTLTHNERLLMDYLEHKKRITVKDYAKMINVSKRRAARILVDLIRGGYIYEHDYNDTCYYTLAG